MQGQFKHFIAISIGALLFVFPGYGLVLLNIDQTLLGFILNVLYLAAVLALIGLASKLLLTWIFKTQVSWKVSLQNVLVLLAAMLISSYGFFVLIFNWPYNTLRTTPEDIQNGELTLGAGLAMNLIALFVWVFWIVRTSRIPKQVSTI